MSGKIFKSVVAVALGVWAGSVQAGAITVPGFSFETPLANPAVTVTTALEHWTTYGEAPFDTGGGPASTGTGAFKNEKFPPSPPGTPFFTGPEVDGNQIAYIFTKSSNPTARDGLEQILDATFGAGKMYTLRIHVGLAGSAPGATEPFTFNLFYFDPANPTARNIVKGRTIYNDASTPLSSTVLTGVEVTTDLLSAGDVAVGKKIGIEIYTALGSDATAASGLQYDFDNVQLTEVPEPGSFMLVAGAAMLLGSRGRRAS